MPVRSDFGYHLIKVHSVTDACGIINAAHIFLKIDPKASNEEVQETKTKADNIYKQLVDGYDWNEAVMRYSDDRGSSTRSGALSPFGVSRLVPEFIETVKQLQPGEFSQPVRTNFGYHIIKLIGTSGVGSFEKERKSIAERVEKDARTRKSEEVVVQQIKKDYGFKNNSKNIEKFIITVDSTILKGHYVPAKEVKTDNTLFTIGKARYTVSDFIDFIETKQAPQKYLTAQDYAYQLYELFEGGKVLEYADEHLEEKYPEFKLLMQEYNDGILLFDLMDKEVWKKAVNDTLGIQDYYERNAANYMWGDRVKASVITVNRPESLPKVRRLLDEGVPYDSLRATMVRDTINFVTVRNGFYQRGDNAFVDQTEWKAGVRNEIPSAIDQSTVIVVIVEVRQPEQKTLGEARGLVTSDYQTEVEEKWLERLREKYPVKMDEKVLNQVRALYP